MYLCIVKVKQSINLKNMKALFITKSRGAAGDLCCLCAEYGLDFSDGYKNGKYFVNVSASSDDMASLIENEIDKSKFEIIKL